MTCPQCGDTQQANDADFCNQCGYQFSAVMEALEDGTSAGKPTVRLATTGYPVYHGGLEGCHAIAYRLRYQPRPGEYLSAELLMHIDGSPTQTGEAIRCGTCHQPLRHFSVVRAGIYEAI